MTFRQRVRALLERWLERYYEGPNPPRRYGEEVGLFDRMYPLALPEEWRTFATALAEKAYREGYMRGLEWTERDLASREEADPEVEAVTRDHEWSLWRDSPTAYERIMAGDPNDPLDGIPREKQAEFLDQLGAVMGTHRVVVVEDDASPDEDAPGS